MTHTLLILALMMVQTANSRMTIYYEFGGNLGQHVPQQLLRHLGSVGNLTVLPRSELPSGRVVNPALILSLGNTSLALQHVNLAGLDPESFGLAYRKQSALALPLLAANGLALSSVTHKNISFSKQRVVYGAVVGSYAALELLGFGFLHPLQPYYPAEVSLAALCQSAHAEPRESSKVRRRRVYVAGSAETECQSIDVSESPYWPERSFHLHTQHPLELTEVLQGHDIPQFGLHGPHCQAFTNARGRPEEESWKARLAQRRMMRNCSAASMSQGECAAASQHDGDDDYTLHSQQQQQQRDGSRAAGGYCERWEDMVPDVNAMFEWAVANRLNKVEWLLLGSYKWGDELDTRHRRLKVLTALGHEYSLLVGADAPLSNVQQHAWTIVNTRLPLRKQIKQIHERVDWILSADFDFLTTESGLSEFTHPECDLMLDLLNAFADHVNGTWGREAGVKVHCSTGQTCENYPDPVTGDPINFNFLTLFARPSLGIFPHTVQVYALDDPTAGSYGNDDFSYMEEYMVLEAKSGNRSVVWYPETAYWVNVDIDVPLFLPIYAQRRLHDLRRIAGRERREGFRIEGQMNFDSGWEWGYWLSDVVTARASWDPLLSPLVDTAVSEASTTTSSSTSNTEKAAEYREADDQWEAFEKSLTPLLTLLPRRHAQPLATLLVTLARAQAELLILGRVDGKPSPNLRKLSGMAYLSGGDTWVDLPRRFGLHLIQPDRVRLQERESSPLWKDVFPLLHAMSTAFGSSREQAEALIAAVESDAGLKAHEPLLELLHEIRQAVTLLALRAEQVWLIYSSADPATSAAALDAATAAAAAAKGAEAGSATPLRTKAEFLTQSRGLLKEAQAVVDSRELGYRVPWQRIAAWRENPTVYRYGFLWAVHSLYYWWRDQGLAEQNDRAGEEHSPCYLNRMDATEIAVGWGKSTAEVIRAAASRLSPLTGLTTLEFLNCLAPPAREYRFPRDLVDK